MCWDKSPRSQFSTEETKKQTNKQFSTRQKDVQTGTYASRSTYLLQTAVHRVRAADVETQQHCIRVTVAQGSDVIVVWRTCIRGKSTNVSTQVVISDKNPNIKLSATAAQPSSLQKENQSNVKLCVSQQLYWIYFHMLLLITTLHLLGNFFGTCLQLQLKWR